ncbi:MAG: NAD(P)-dependent oxidoreductase [Nitrososphaerales archaeon]|nr:NAD(P)-dependent oxidoreductase [Nitrososphaerales archaeon]
MPSRTRNVSLVTGGSGLLGSRLVRRLLDDGQKVRVLDTRYGELSELKSHDGMEFFGIGKDELHGGMVDRRTVEEATRGVNIIYHLAINWDGFTWRHRLPLPDLFGANIRGTLNLLEAARSHRVKHLLFSSSSAVYGDTQRTISLRGRPLSENAADEDAVCRPELWDGDPGPAYAVVKLALEKLCLMYHHQYGLPVTVFRIEYVFVDQKQVDDGANIHVDDVVRAFLLATLNQKAYGQVFNIACAAPYISTRKIEKTLGWKPLRTRQFLEGVGRD